MPRFPAIARRPAATAVLAALASLAACSASSPPVHWHTLMPAEPTPRTAPAAAAPQTIVLEPIRVPAQVDQPQWVVRLPDDSLAVLEQERWASPLADELRQALLEALAARHGAVELQSPATAGPPPIRIRLDLRRIDSIPGREARLEGSWTLTAAGRRPLRCEALLREPATVGMPALAAAHRRAVARLADAVGAGLAAVRSGSSACPPVEAG